MRTSGDSSPRLTQGGEGDGRRQRGGPIIAYLGPAGTYTEQAAVELAGPSAELVPHQTVPAALRAVVDGTATAAVVPVENALEGAVNVTLDFLTHEPDPPSVVGEAVVSVHHMLAAQPGATLAQIHTVCSHPQALAQCRGRLEVVLPDAKQVAVASTAEAARLVAAAARDDVDALRIACISSRRAVDLHGLQVLTDDIQDDLANATRFWMVSKHLAAATGQDKTSIVFSVPHRTGTLHQALAVFAAHTLNLTRIESRPSRRRLGEYLFFVDFEGHVSEPAPKLALAALRELANWVRVMGSYPAARR